MAHIDYYFATISPNTYIAGTRMEAVAAKHGATITYKPVDIMGLFARTGGTPPGERHESRQNYRLQEIRRQAAKAGLPINVKPMFWPANPAPSSYALIAAQKEGGGDMGALVFALTRACWAEERNIAEDDVIRAALEEAGFDGDLVNRGMLAGAEEYVRNLDDAVAAGAFGAPFYIVDGTEHFWGQDRIDDLDHYLASLS
ncbi:2-hydroxychromene-2-carboxylate isomerase [Gymnodinialimonas ceratoperidinii]|uniref:2-hydroxychromene-2-carboxylate isomerase n=1 Tax=Gymnodinialimonas ceratoperidinii TaxID=2856823 RepID=A0A8F6TV37_9RHOB|nr:2-hydroxychromene-2-carboxylate isomerase [Gymnodinialimonas ceratoperidinii]QXT39260.1 2-hydroxychromene-2-carboxylate isomerase [Gymnodinialimonas ceratoperidinii]